MSDDLVGIASHGGQHSHAHWVSLDGTQTTHLDRWGLKAGAILLLPKTIMSLMSGSGNDSDEPITAGYVRSLG